jgi:cell division protein FtsB
LKSEVEELQIMERYIKTKNELLKKNSAKMMNENDQLKEELRKLEENEKFIQEKAQAIGKLPKGIN